MEDQTKRLLIVDGTNCYWRAYHGLFHQHFEHDGAPTWGIYGTLNTISTSIRNHRPSHVIVVFDWGKSEYRLKIWSRYKAGRPTSSEYIDFEDANNQLEKTQNLLPQFGIQVWREHGIEADDIIASLVRLYGNKVENIIVVSGDKDMRQLISENVELYQPSLGNKPEQHWTLQSIYDHYGVTPDRLPEIWALSGDKVDNIPGVPGIGEKTAIKLIEKYGDVSMVTLSDEKKIQGYIHDIHMSMQLVKLNPDLSSFDMPLSALEFHPVLPGDGERAKVLRTSLKEIGFDKVLSRWTEGTLWMEKGIRLKDLKQVQPIP